MRESRSVHVIRNIYRLLVCGVLLCSVAPAAAQNDVRLSGVVRDSLTAPVVETRVLLSGFADGVERVVRQATTTDSAGRFEFELAPGVYSFEVAYFAGSIAGRRQVLRVDSLEVRQSRAVDLVVPPIYTVSGRAADEGGEPVWGIEIGTFFRGGVPNRRGPVRSGEDGRFEFAAPAGKYRFFVRPPEHTGLYMQTLDLVVDGDEDIAVDLARGHLLTGQVVDDAGAPLADVSFRLENYTGAGLVQVTGSSSGAFSFIVDPRQPAHILSCSIFGSDLQSRRIPLLLRGDLDLEVTLRGQFPDVYPARTRTEVKWGFAAQLPVNSPVLTPDGRLYFADDATVYAIDDRGRGQWVLLGEELVGPDQFWRTTGPLAADAAGHLYFGSREFTVREESYYFQALDAAGRPLWRRPLAGAVTDAPAIAADGTVYVGSHDGLHAFSPQGEERWRFALDGTVTGAPAIAADGTIYVGTVAGTLYALAADGTERWRRDLEAPIASAPALDREGGIYVGTISGPLVALDDRGNILWSFADESLWLYSAPSITSDGALYAMARDTERQILLALAPGGRERWRLPFEPEYDFATPLPPTIGADGTLYVWGSSHYLHAVGADGQRLWSYAFARAESAPALGADGTLYVGADAGIYALQTASPGLDSGWPRFGGGHANAGRLDAVAGGLATERRTALYTDESSTRLPLERLQRATMDAAPGDFDSDGDLDLLLAQEFDPNILLLNEGGRFVAAEDRIPQTPHDSEDVGVADFDLDGDLDAVVVTEDDRVDELYLNDGRGFFTAAGDRLPAARSNAVAVGDVDADGDPDIVVGNNGVNALLLNDGDAFFAQAAEERFPAPLTDITQDVELGDADADGDLDLMVGNEGDNRLLLNDGQGVFTDVSDRLPLRADTEETREADFGDADADGDLDLYFGNVVLFNNSGMTSPQNRLLLNDGQAFFTDATAERLPADTGNSFDVDFLDLDSDGYLDLASANSFPRSPYRAYENDGRGFFTEATATFFPPSAIGNGFDIAAVDADGDGRFDLYLSSQGGSDRLLMRQGPVTAVGEDRQTIPGDFALFANYPNPFNAATTIPYRIATRTKVHLDIYSITGQRVRRLVDGVRTPGEYAARWDGRDDEGVRAASGVYLYRLREGGWEQSRLLLLLK